MTTDNEILFGEIGPDGRITAERTIRQSAINACPHVILVASHYREDGTCRCDDPDHTEMVEWGYRWVADDDGFDTRYARPTPGRWT